MTHELSDALDRHLEQDTYLSALLVEEAAGRQPLRMMPSPHHDMIAEAGRMLGTEITEEATSHEVAIWHETLMAATDAPENRLGTSCEERYSAVSVARTHYARALRTWHDERPGRYRLSDYIPPIGWPLSLRTIPDGPEADAQGVSFVPREGGGPWDDFQSCGPVNALRECLERGLHAEPGDLTLLSTEVMSLTEYRRRRPWSEYITGPDDRRVWDGPEDDE